MKRKIEKRKKIEAVAAIIAVVLALFIVGIGPVIVADDPGDPVDPGMRVFAGNVTVFLNATDIGSGVNCTYYVLDPEGVSPGTQPPLDDYGVYTGSFVVSDLGDHIIWYYSDDIAGNVEEVQSKTFRIIAEDSIPPVTNCSLVGNEVEPTP